MQDSADFARRYRRFLGFLAISQRLLPLPLASALAARSAPYLSPHRALQAAVSQGMSSALALSPEALEILWQRYLRYAGSADLLTFLYRRMNPTWLGRYIQVQGQEVLDAQQDKGRGLFVMTYHNHYPHFLAAVMGLLQHKTYLVAMDYEISPLYPYMSQIIDKYHIDCAKHFYGGEYLFMTEKTPVRLMRKLHQVLQEGHLVVSLNDFPSPFVSKRNLPIELFGRRYLCPTGTVEIALQQGARIVVGWARGVGRGRFVVELYPLSGTTVETVMDAYVAKLHELIALDPALWEGWKWLPP